MALHWGTEYLMQCLPLELKAKFQQTLVDPFYDGDDTGYPFCDGSTGEVLTVVPGVAPKRISRKKLRTLLAEDIDIRVCGCHSCMIAC